MTKLIDGDRLEVWLRAQDGVHPELIQLVLDDFVYQPPQTPIKDIDVPTKLKVRRNAPGTSWEAAYAQSAGKSRVLYEAIYSALWAHGPQTDDEIRKTIREVMTSWKFANESVTMRRGELVKAGWVRATGTRRPSDVGASMMVWEAIPAAG